LDWPRGHLVGGGVFASGAACGYEQGEERVFGRMAGRGDGEVFAQRLRAEQADILPGAVYTFAGDEFRGEVVEGIQLLPPAAGTAIKLSRSW